MCNELIDFSQLGSTWSANKECKAIACYVLIDFIEYYIFYAPPEIIYTIFT